MVMIDKAKYQYKTVIRYMFDIKNKDERTREVLSFSSLREYLYVVFFNFSFRRLLFLFGVLSYGKLALFLEFQLAKLLRVFFRDYFFRSLDLWSKSVPFPLYKNIHSYKVTPYKIMTSYT